MASPERSRFLLLWPAELLALTQFSESLDLVEICQESDANRKTVCTLDLVRPPPWLRYREWDERPHRAGFSFFGGL